MGIKESVLTYMDVTGKTKKPVPPAGSREQNSAYVRVDSTSQQREHFDYLDYLKQCDQFAIDNGMTPLTVDGRYQLQPIAEFIKYAIDECRIAESSRTYYRNRYKALEAKYNELCEFVNATNQDQEYAKWKEQQKQGRPRKTIDWERYDLLSKAQLSQKEIAQILGVSPNTLRKLLKER